jgi:arsenite methyltransferase
MATIDITELTTKVQDVYRHVAQEPDGYYHFEMGRPLAERLGYPADLLAGIPAEAVASFAGVGYFLDLADVRAGDRVLDLGSGSGTDSFAAARLTGGSGIVLGIDFTAEQLNKARRLAAHTGINHVEFREGRIEDLTVPDCGVDRVISNGVINLSPDKARVFAEVARVLRPGGRLAIADIVTERPLTEAIVGNADLWASCIGGAAHADAYREIIEAAGLRVTAVRSNPYQFLSPLARAASSTYGVKSISLLAVKPGG